MSEQQYRVVADRTSMADDSWITEGDRVTYGSVSSTGELVIFRIERPVPTIDEQPEFEGSTPRGFGITEFHYRGYDDGGQQRFSVQESSIATERKVWIGPGDERAHLNETEARRVRDALNAFLGERSAPTRGQIAEALTEALPDDMVVISIPDVARHLHAALLQNGADR